MDRKATLTFLGLILVQAAHSVEEYAFRLYEVFPPARFVSGFVSNDLRSGFLVLNLAIVGFGLWCYLVPVRRGVRYARGLSWFWIVLELVNGAVHLTFALAAMRYWPGAATAPILLAVAGSLALQLRRPVSPDSAAA
jgi:hypothetical protein